MDWLRVAPLGVVLGVVMAVSGCGDDDGPADGDGAVSTDATSTDGGPGPQDDGATGDAHQPELCGGVVCDDNQQCCGTGVTAVCHPADTACPEPPTTCSGPNDCEPTQDCCFDSGAFTCVAEGTCDGTLILCATTAECTGDQVCCGEDTVTCQSSAACGESPVRCAADTECTNAGVGDCCVTPPGMCSDECPG